ncbi:2Fe-2S iron-sulfur cluster binding domain-containing protein [Peptoniphilus equinus]|uniref:2Fe-2S iron-sulfur cluster binding domain-containing protein n=1 Tax=Peptoniphilus equinus TaxID=3016343 RepID=A0ABY7QTF8_9FIRM|nr:2Fe-2S iron-sulfur cluster binding domain-containing protein [Peptoniphilus equinus]WBW50073.1 2Fe-2S iron-sulfur cluster binding domain-containing protein [Peptoniphilus equinus]
METILITVAVITVIAAILALLLSLADKYIADYGDVELTINANEPLTVSAGNSLLSTLRDEKIFIPSACGGKGTCGYCKVKVLEGGGPILATEKSLVTAEEAANGVRLSCQLKVKNNIHIEIPEELFNVREFEAEVIGDDHVTKTIKRMRFKLPADLDFNFKPGQYVQLKAPPYEGSDEEVYRAYSIASSAGDHGHLELLIGYTGGIATTYVHQHLKQGDTVDINGPYGDFYYQDGDSDILLVAAGTGMAPIISILHHMRDNNIQRKARFFFGAKTPDDLFMTDELKQFEKDLYDFKYLPTLSRVTDDMAWDGDRGRVNVSIEKYVEDGGNYTAYLCGSPQMIDSIVESLHQKHIPDEAIFFDKF